MLVFDLSVVNKPNVPFQIVAMCWIRDTELSAFAVDVAEVIMRNSQNQTTRADSGFTRRR